MSPRGKQANGLLTQQKMLRAAVTLFLEKGYGKTTTAEIAEAAGMAQSSFFRAFSSKEALLLELVRRMFTGQFALAEQHSGEADPVFLYAVETALQLHICELSESLRDLYTSAYTLPTTADYIYRSTAQELQQIFGKYLPSAALSDFYELDLVSAGVMRGLMARRCDMYFPIEKKVALFLRCALKIYDVPEAEHEAVISRVQKMDLDAMARSMLEKTVQLSQAGFDTDTLRASAADEQEVDRQ